MEVLKLPAVRTLVQRSESSIRRDIKDSRFPAPLRIGRRSIGWLRSDIEAWLLARKS